MNHQDQSYLLESCGNLSSCTVEIEIEPRSIFVSQVGTNHGGGGGGGGREGWGGGGGGVGRCRGGGCHMRGRFSNHAVEPLNLRRIDVFAKK